MIKLDRIILKKLLFVVGILVILRTYYISKNLSTTLIDASTQEFDPQKFLVLVGSFWISGIMCCLYSLFKK